MLPLWSIIKNNLSTNVLYESLTIVPLTFIPYYAGWFIDTQSRDRRPMTLRAGAKKEGPPVRSTVKCCLGSKEWVVASRTSRTTECPCIRRVSSFFSNDLSFFGSRVNLSFHSVSVFSIGWVRPCCCCCCCCCSSYCCVVSDEEAVFSRSSWEPSGLSCPTVLLLQIVLPITSSLLLERWQWF